MNEHADELIFIFYKKNCKKMKKFKTDRNATSTASFWKILSPMESSDSQQKFGASLVLRGVVKVDFRTTWNLRDCFFLPRKKCKNLRCFLMQNDFFCDFSKIMHFFIEKVDFKKGSKLVLLRIAERRDLYHNVAESLSFLEMKEFFKSVQYLSRLDRS